MRIKQITLPNGFTNNGEFIRRMEIRKLGGQEEDLLVDKEELKKGTVLFQILKNCTVSLGGVDDPKLISAIYDGPFLAADLSYVLVELRAWGLSPEYVYEHQCPACETIGKHAINLHTLRVDAQPEEHRGKNRFIATLENAPKPFGANGDVLPEREWSYGDVTFSFRPLYMKDQKMLEAIRSDYPKQRATRELGLYLLEYDGVDAQNLDPKTLQKFDGGTRSAMRELIDATSGGIDTEVMMTCRKCTKAYKDNIPVDAKHFFFRKGATSETRTATPYREGGPTLISWQQGSDGSQAKSSDSASKSDSST